MIERIRALLTVIEEGISFVPVRDDKTRWDFIVLWQKSRSSPATRAVLEALKPASQEK